MKRRTLLIGSAAVLGTAGITALVRPEKIGGPHDPYFTELNELLRREGPGRPVMLLDLERMNHNIDEFAAACTGKTYRVVVKSLPSLPLLRHVMERARTRALMVFHQPFLSAVAAAVPDADVLLGKPMPVAAAATFYRLHTVGLDPARQVQWLIDSDDRLAQYAALATTLGVRMRVNVEIDLGLRRGGLRDPEQLDALLARIDAAPERLEFAGFMGYEPHIAGVADRYEHPAVQGCLATYRGFVERVKQRYPGVDVSRLTLNGAGSHTLRLYRQDTLLNDLSAGSGVVKPSDFDTALLATHAPAAFIATPILKRMEGLAAPGDPWQGRLLSWWNRNQRRTYFVYGGYWKAIHVSPEQAVAPLYHSSNQEMVTTSNRVNLSVDDYMFLRPTQSEAVLLEFGDLLVVGRDAGRARIANRWPVLQSSG